MGLGCCSLAACAKPHKEDYEQGNINLFPKPAEGYAGDPIPFYDGENLNVYYIHDARGWNEGYFHPWNLFRTKNYTEWEDKGRVIEGNFNDKANQDYGIGTGTVLEGRDGGITPFTRAGTATPKRTWSIAKRCSTPYPTTF